MGLVSRRCYCWILGCFIDYWDEVFIVDGFEGYGVLDD